MAHQVKVPMAKAEFLYWNPNGGWRELTSTSSAHTYMYSDTHTHVNK